MKSSVFSRCLKVLRVAADVTGTGRQQGKPDHRRWKDESAERQGCRWWLFSLIIKRHSV